MNRSLAARVRRPSAHLPAHIVAEGLVPAVLPDGLPTQDGWVCLVRGPHAAMAHIGDLPLPIRRGDRVVGEVVEVELRGEEWWGRVVGIDGKWVVYRSDAAAPRAQDPSRRPSHKSLLGTVEEVEVTFVEDQGKPRQNRQQRRAEAAKARRA